MDISNSNQLDNDTLFNNFMNSGEEFRICVKILNYKIICYNTQLQQIVGEVKRDDVMIDFTDNLKTKGKMKEYIDKWFKKIIRNYYTNK